MKRSDYFLIGGALVAAYVMFDMVTIKRRFYMSELQNARLNVKLAANAGLIQGGDATIYLASLNNGTVSPVELNDGLIGMAA